MISPVLELLVDEEARRFEVRALVVGVLEGGRVDLRAFGAAEPDSRFRSRAF